ncbi:MAG: tetratricopeptide repeat protein, partial [Anaerolineae bacterium]|nr:tetratricopeptide repeat protein [Anaerolineae bacterium]
MSEIEEEGRREWADEPVGEGRVEVIDVQAAVRKYLECLLDDPELQRLSSSYVPMRLAPADVLGSRSGEEWCYVEGEGTLHNTADLLPSLELAHRVVLVGQAGGGKSATLQWLACEQAKRVLEGGGGARGYVPLYVELRAAQAEQTWQEVLAAPFEEYELPVDAESIVPLLRSNRVLLLLDGVERIRDNQILDDLARLTESAEARCVAACRTEDYRSFRRWLEEPCVLELQGFNEAERIAYLEAQLPEAARTYAMWRARGDAHLWHLLRIPLYCAVYAELVRDAPAGAVRGAVSSVVREGVQRLLESTAEGSDATDPAQVKQRLAGLALQMQRLGQWDGIQLGAAQVMAQLDPTFSPLARQWLSSLGSTGLVEVSSQRDRVSFSDPMVRDFFAAQGLSQSYSGALPSSICLDSEETAERWEGVLIHLYHLVEDRLGYLQQLLDIHIDGWGPRIAAQCLAYNEDPQEARELAASLALIDGLDLSSAYKLGVALKGMGQKDDAALVFRGIIEREQGDMRLRRDVLGYRHKYRSEGRHDHGAGDPGKIISRRNLGLLYREMDQMDRAVSELEAAAEGANAACSDTYHELGLAYLKKGQLQDALSAFQHAIALSPEIAAYRCSLGAVLNRLQRYAEAQAELQQATLLDAKSADAYLELGLAYEQQGWYAEALAAYQSAESRERREASCPQRIARLLSMQERWDEAAAALQKAVALAPGRADWHYELATIYERKNEPSEALAEYRHAAYADRNNAQYQYKAGVLAREMGRLVEATDFLDRAVEREPERADWAFDLASVLAAQGRDDEARVRCEGAVQMAPGETRYRVLAGSVLRRLRQRGEAESHLRKALELDPGSAEAHSELGRVLDEQGAWEDAVREYEAAISLEAGVPRYHQELGSALGRMGRLDAAESSLKKAIDLDPSSAEALGELGAVYELMKHDADALRLYSEAVTAAPDRPDYHLRAAALSHKLGRLEEMRAHLERASALSPNNGEVCFLFGQVREAEGVLEEALERYEDAIALSPHEAEYHVRAASVSRRLGRLNEARAEAEKAVELEPERPELGYELGRVLQEMHKVQEAAAALQRAAEVAPQDPEIQLHYARALRDLGRGEEAARVLEAAQRFVTAPVSIYTELADLYSSQERAADAVRQLDEAISLESDNATHYLNKGKLLREHGEVAHSVAPLQRALELSPRDPEIMWELGRSLEETDNPEEALSHYAEAVNLAPNDSRYQLSLGMARRVLGEMDGAAKALACAVDLAPEDPETNHQLGDFYLDDGEAERALPLMEKATSLRPG